MFAVSAAAAAPDRATIAFVGDLGLLTVGSDGTGVTMLARRRLPGHRLPPCPGAEAATWSPDGSTLAAVVGTQLWLFGTDGTSRLLPTGVAVSGKSSPAWSPDGRRIAFLDREVVDGFGTLFDIHVIDLDTNAVRRLTVGNNVDGPRLGAGPAGRLLERVRQPLRALRRRPERRHPAAHAPGGKRGRPAAGLVPERARHRVRPPAPDRRRCGARAHPGRRRGRRHAADALRRSGRRRARPAARVVARRLEDRLHHVAERPPVAGHADRRRPRPLRRECRRDERAAPHRERRARRRRPQPDLVGRRQPARVRDRRPRGALEDERLRRQRGRHVRAPARPTCPAGARPGSRSARRRKPRARTCRCSPAARACSAPPAGWS